MDNLSTVSGNHIECWQQPARTYFSKNLEALNRQYKAMTPTERIVAFYKCVQQKIACTSAETFGLRIHRM